MLTDDIKKTIQAAYSGLLESKDLKPRYGQRLMIAEVAKTLMSSDQKIEGQQAPICVVEAGTGTGKTIAYTVAAVPVAAALNKTLVISTATIALQEQIVYKDLPDIQQHSGLNFSYSLAKGRGRYLCLTKLDALLQGQAANKETMALYPDEQQAQVDQQTLTLYEDMLSAMASGNWDGDRDDWPEEIAQPSWSRVTTDHVQCTGRRCANVSQCCFYKARESLDKVDIIVTNHDLVMADLALGGGAILPEPEDCIFIFDEGHHLADKALNHFSHFSRVHSTVRWLEQANKLIAKAAVELGDRAGIDRYLQAMVPVVDNLKTGLGFLANSLAELEGIEEKSGYRFAKGIVAKSLREQSQLLGTAFRELFDQLDKCCAILNEAMEEHDHPISKTDAEAWYPGLAMIKNRAEGNCFLWQDFGKADAEENPPQSRWISLSEDQAGNIDFDVYSSPVLAANTLDRFLWRRCSGAVVTSATLTALNSFSRFMMHAGTSEDASYAVVPSPFDFAGSGQIVVPAMTSDPSSPEDHTDELVDLLPEIIDSAEGTLVLYSSRRQMEEVYDRLSYDWQERIIMQGDYSKQEALRRHKEAIDQNKGSVLFGLASFAEGVDLPGRYCTHVIIAKIPFAVPDQPVDAALAEWVEAKGGNPFMEITVPDAALKLIQSSGRLLRTETDTGKVTLLDRRIVTKRYGRALLDSLPPFERIVS